MKPAAHTLALLVANPADRRLLEETLRAAGYVTSDRLPVPNADDAPVISLLIADEATATKSRANIAELRRQAPEKFIPALVLLSPRTDSAFWLENGFNDALRLPIKKAELLSRVQTFLHLKERSEDALRQNAERNDAILELAMDAIIVMDCNGRILEFNGSAERLFGYARSTAIGADLAELIIPLNARDRHRRGLAAAVNSNHAGPSKRLETIALRAGGEEFPVEISFTRVVIHGETQFAGFVRDLTERKSAQASLSHLAAVVESSNDAIISKTLDGRILTWNKAAELLFGYTAEEAIGMSIVQLLPPGREAEEEHIIANVVSGNRYVGQETQRRHKNGGIIDVSVSVSPIRDADGRIIGASKIARDITSQIQARERLRRVTRIHTVLSGINGLIVRVRTRNELFAGACRIAVEAGGFYFAWLGWADSKESCVKPIACDGAGDEFMHIVPRAFMDAKPDGRNLIARAIATKAVVVSNDVQNDPESSIKNESRAHGINSVAILPLTEMNVPVGILALCAAEKGFFDDDELKLLTELADDISFALDHIQKTERLDHLAYYDALTGLANRALLHDRINQAIAGAARRGSEVAVAFIDLDNFKLVNDSLGHNVGDELLKIIAARLPPCLRETDTVARLGGDEFVLVLPHERRPDATSASQKTSDARRTELIIMSLVRRVRTEVTKPIRLADREFRPTCSIGISVFPQDGTDPETLLRNADIAMYRAKELGRNNFQFFTADMHSRAHQRMDLESRLKLALERNEFELHYQPQADLLTGRIIGVEALLRWRDPQQGLVGPDRFIDFAEESGLIVPIGEWVLHRACQQNKAWQDAGLLAVPIAVNMSAKQCAQLNIELVVANALRTSGLAAQFLELELTESSSMANPEKMVPLLQRLKQMGITLSLDDFGTGYSSISYLKRFPVDKLKLDISFVREITTDADSLAISEAIITMGHSLKLRVLAEGVETEGQLALLLAHGCDEIQGYFFSRPVMADDLAKLLRDGRGLSPILLRGNPKPSALLVVDDDFHVVDLVQRVAHHDGFRMLSACNASEGLEILARDEVGVVVCVQRTPGMAGAQFLAKVRGMYPDTVRILISEYDDIVNTREAINLGAIFKFLDKSWTPAQLTQVLKEAFQQYRKTVMSRGQGRVVDHQRSTSNV